MYDAIKVRNLIIGEGSPKICVPIVAVVKEKILETALKVAARSVDLVEWRADFFHGVQELKKMVDLLKELRKIMGDIPILFTFRTTEEGGMRSISMEDYTKINLAAIKSGCVDLIDVEVFRGKEVIDPIIKSAHKKGVKVIGSNHDFKNTPSKEEIIERLQMMQSSGVDITKIAVMPNSQEDTLTLMSATLAMKEKFADRPFITMSMGSMGFISRITGEMSGSSVTFGSIGRASAPGQIPVEKLEQVLNIFHRYGL